MLHMGPPGRWWDDPDFVKRLGLSTDQQKKMDDIFNTNRLKLIDQFAALQKEEAIMEPLVAADPPDENKLLAQIDRVRTGARRTGESQRPHAAGHPTPVDPRAMAQVGSRSPAHAWAKAFPRRRSWPGR